jgi:hypothetical protein
MSLPVSHNFTRREIVGLTTLTESDVDYLYRMTVLSNDDGADRIGDNEERPDYEAAALWLAALFTDTLLSPHMSVQVAAYALDYIAACRAWLNAVGNYRLPVAIHDRRYLCIGHWPPFDMEATEALATLPPTLEKLEYDVIELYRRNRDILLAARKGSEACPEPSD